MPERGVAPHDCDGGPPLRGLKLPPGNGGRIAKGAEDLGGPEWRETGQASRRVTRHLAPAALDASKERRHPLHRFGRRVGVIEIVEEPEERIRCPFRRQLQQVEEVPNLDGMNLHRRRGQQDEALGALLE